MERFDRNAAKEIAQEIKKVLNERYGAEKFEFSIPRGTFCDDKLSFNLVVRRKNEDGTLTVSDNTHKCADMNAAREGLKFEGHLIGSIWAVNGKCYIVTDYHANRSRYPISLKCSDGTAIKANNDFLMKGIQYLAPAEREFVKWFTIDPDSDAVRESDVEICDRVQGYLECAYPAEQGDKFFGLVDKFNEKGIAKKWAKRAYELLFKEAPATIEHAYLGLKVIYKEETGIRKSKSKTSEK